jgi:hypothetical protein
MIAIRGSIGSGLFIGSGGALSTGGPAILITGTLRLLKALRISFSIFLDSPFNAFNYFAV